MSGASLGTAYVQIMPTAKGISGSISGLLGGEAASAGTSAGAKIGAFAKKAIIAAGIGAVMVKGIKGAMDEGAKLQQSYLGGIDTLYGEAADAARSYAREAAAAGISMNDYSEQAVSFGAALKNAFGGDVQKAAKAANTAIMDMADNSAKMGTDITSVQMAYQGFAKQNYTMLDNLKLGYGGTKTEMERLLADAEKLSGQKYSIDNLGDVYDAIHVIQGDLGLTGVAAQEASETFSGSFNAMKASAQNFLGSLALGENVSESLGTLMTSASTFFFGNFIPMLGTIISSLPSAIATFFAQGVPLLLSNISNLISTLATNITSVANGLTGAKVAEWASTTIPKIIVAAGKMILNFAKSLLSNLPKIAVALVKIGTAIVTGLGSALWGKVTAAANGIKERFLAPINAMRDKVKGIIDKIKNFFPVSIGKILSNVKLPHFSIKGKFSLTPPSTPKLSVSWYEKGGIFDGATVLGGSIGVGEAGPEAILPLTPFWKKMDEIKDALSSGSSPVTVNVYAAPGQDPEEIADIAVQKIITVQNRRRLAWQ